MDFGTFLGSIGKSGDRTRKWFNHRFTGGGKRSAPFAKQKPWQRQQFLRPQPSIANVVTRQQWRAELRKQHFRQLSSEYPGEPRHIRRAMAFDLAKRIYKGMRPTEMKEAA